MAAEHTLAEQKGHTISVDSRNFEMWGQFPPPPPPPPPILEKCGGSVKLMGTSPIPCQ